MGSVLAAGFVIKASEKGQLVGDLGFQPSRDRTIPTRRTYPVGKLMLAGRITMGLVMSVTVFAPMAQLFHQFGRRVSQVHGYIPAFIFSDKGPSLVVRHVAGIALGRYRQINHSLCQSQLAFGRSK